MNFNVVYNIFHAISACACVFVLFYYFKGKEKTFSQKIIVALGLSDFIFHTAFLSDYIISHGSFLSDLRHLTGINFKMIIRPTIVTIQTAAITFSVIWSCSIAFFLYKYLRLAGTYSSQKHFQTSIVVLLPISIIFGFIRAIKETDVLYSLILPCMISLCFVVFFSIRSLLITKKQLVSPTIQYMIKNLCRCSFAQVCIISPAILIHIFDDWTAFGGPIFGYITSIIYGLPGLVIAVLYFVQVRQERKLRGCIKETSNSNTLDLSIITERSLEETLSH